jgi:hypothetical protein
MKTPKEIAIELVEKFTRSQYYGCLGCGEDYDDKQESAKQCALIAVDEIIKYSPNKPDYESDPIEYFNKVKQEIEKL